MINLQNVFLKRGTKELFAGLNLSIHTGHRVGIVGRNGIGKSTLFSLIRERLLPEEGEVKLPKRWVIAHLDQEIRPSSLGALEWAMDGDRPLREVQRRIAAAEADAAHGQLAGLYADLEAIDGYTAESRAGQILHGLGFDGEDFARSVSDFSGGWRMRLNLAQTLMCRSDLLLLDEPTNHLDLDANMWLEHWLVRREETTLIISHDRDFLDRVITDVVHLEAGRARSYRGDYSSFERQRAERLALEQAMYNKQQKRVREIEAFVNRFKAKATKARQAQSRLKQLERMVLIAPAHADSPYRFSFPNPDKVSNPLLHLEEASLGYAGVVVLEHIRMTLQPGARIALLGRNGAGKSTLMRGLAGVLPFNKGVHERGKHAVVGYFAQHTLETLKPQQSATEHLTSVDGKASDQRMRTYLGGWGFPGQMAFNPVESFSGGEKARLALALIAWRKPALLILDEPTNHLDLEMRHALTVALQSYEGALVIVSHDRHLIENNVDELFLIADHRVNRYTGTLDEYRDWLLGREVRRTPGKPAETGKRTARRRDGAQKRGQVKPLRDALRKIETNMEQLQAKLQRVTDQLADTETYQRASNEEVSGLIGRHKRYASRIAILEEDWLAASERLDAASVG